MAQDPENIGRYRVIRALGRGGMGVVYLAEDPLLKRRVAVKIVRGGGLQQEEAQARFQREAEVSARLSHPNVITVHDVGEEPGIGPFLTMEYVEGASLAELAREGTLDAEIRLRALLQGRRALEVAHAAGIVHRDIKPANLMLGRDGRVRLMDFGIARSDHGTLTATGSVIGTPSYLAPEQVEGAEASVVTDRYAFAVMAFELFVGRTPFSASNTSAILYKIAHESPDVPDSLDPRLRAVFLRALAKDPAARYASLGAFLSDLLDAVDLDPAARTRLRGQLEEDGPVAREAPSLQAASTHPTTVVDLHPGLSLSRIMLWSGGALAAVAAAGALVFVMLREPEPAARATGEISEGVSRDLSPTGKEDGIDDSVAPVNVAAVAAPMEVAAPMKVEPMEVAAVAPAVPAAPAGPDPHALLLEARSRLAETASGEDVDIAAIAESTVFLRGEARGEELERIEKTLRSLEGIEHVDTTAVRVWPTAEEALPEIRRRLREEGLAHVTASVDGRGHLVLAGLVSGEEESRAREIAAEIGGDDLSLVASIRKPPVAASQPSRAVRPVEAAVRPTPAPPPAWGAMRHEGAERTE